MVRCPECGHVFHRIGHKQTLDPGQFEKSLEGMFRMLEIGAVNTRALRTIYRRIKKILCFRFERVGPGDTCYFIAGRIG